MTWEEAIIFARTTLNEKLISDKEIHRLQESSRDLERFVLVIQLLYQDSKERPVGISGIHYLLQTVDRSIYTLKDWIDGIFLFHNWLKTADRKTDFRKMLGYLQCCEESPEKKDTRVLFTELITQMLEEHGYLG